MKYLKRFNEEVSNHLKNDMEIIYRDENMVCILPKTQKAAHIYGYRTKWCSVDKKRWDELTFDHKSIRFFFLFKEKDSPDTSHGYKLRLSYIPSLKTGDWADSLGKHILGFTEKDPFKIDKHTNDPNEYRAIIKILSIPEKCKNEIRKYILGEKKVDYIKQEDEYKPRTNFGKKMYDDKYNYYTFKHDTLPGIKSLLNKEGYDIDSKYNAVKRKFILYYKINGESKEEEYNDFDSFQNGVLKLMDQIL